MACMLPSRGVALKAQTSRPAAQTPSLSNGMFGERVSSSVMRAPFAVSGGNSTATRRVTTMAAKGDFLLASAVSGS